MKQCPQRLHFWTDHEDTIEESLCATGDDKDRDPLDIEMDAHAVLSLETTRSFIMLIVIQGLCFRLFSQFQNDANTAV